MRQRVSALAKTVLLFACLVYSIGHSAQTQIEKFVPGSTLEGVSYFLPRTALRVVVKAEKKTVTPGEFNMYAFKYMRIQNVPVQASTTWSVKEINVFPYGLPDKDKAYSLKLKSRTVAPLVSLSHDGLLLGINTEVSEEQLPPIPENRLIQKGISLEDTRRYMNREMLQAGSAAKMAELAAREIYDIRESRDALVRGEADNSPKDGEQLKLMLDNLDEQQRVLGSLFLSSTEISEIYYVLDIVPSEEVGKLVLFRFSKWSGMVDSDDMSGEPYYIEIRKEGTLPASSLDAKVEEKKGKLQRAVYYNIPALSKVRIFNAQSTIVEYETPIAQFGHQEVLSNVLFDKMADTRVSFFQSTGGIKEIKANKVK